MHQYKCPDLKCDYTAEYITTNHYLTAHGMSKEEMLSEHGEPVKLNYDYKKLMKNRRYNGKLSFANKQLGTLDKMMDTYVKEHKQIKKDEWDDREED